MYKSVKNSFHSFYVSSSICHRTFRTKCRNLAKNWRTYICRYLRGLRYLLVPAEPMNDQRGAKFLHSSKLKRNTALNCRLRSVRDQVVLFATCRTGNWNLAWEYVLLSCSLLIAQQFGMVVRGSASNSRSLKYPRIRCRLQDNAWLTGAMTLRTTASCKEGWSKSTCYFSQGIKYSNWTFILPFLRNWRQSYS